MKLDWYTCLGHDGQCNAGTSILWTDYGIYQWINREEGFTLMLPPTIEIVFFPKPGRARVLERIGIFKGEDRIEQAEAAVERDMDNKSGRWLLTRMANDMEMQDVAAEPHGFVSDLGSEFCAVCGNSCIGHRG